MAETSKAKPRLIENGFYAKHIEGKKVIDDDLSIDIFDSVYNIKEVWYFIDTTYNTPIVQRADGSKMKLIRKQAL